MTEKTPLNYRPATEADVPQLLKLICTAFRGEEGRKGWTTEADLVADDRISAGGLLAKVTNPNGVVLVVTHTDNHSLVACCELSYRPEDRVVYFGLFAVDSGLQGGGIGRRVLNYAEGYARERWGARRMEMWVIFQRAELIAWYVRRGFVVSGQTVPFPYHEIVNGKALRDDLYFEVLVKELEGGAS